MSKDVISIYPIAEKILYLREQKVIIDRDLARLYGSQTRVLNQAVSVILTGSHRLSLSCFARRNRKDITVCDILFESEVFETSSRFY